MNIFKFFSSLWNKLVWVTNLVYTFVSPIYNDVVTIIKEVQASNLEDEVARKAVFAKITAVLKAKGLKMSDSLVNTIIEMVYQLIKQGKA